MNIKKLVFISVTAVIIMALQGCGNMDNSASKDESKMIFPKGDPAPAEYFTGDVWLTGLVENDTVFTTAAGSVYFEAGARSNWHSHPAGQILIVTEGVGYHQIKGEPIEVIRPGDVVKCPPDVVHWHGASKDSGMSHIYIVPNTEKGIVNWMDPVTDEEYGNI